jgi:hypothetical protein
MSRREAGVELFRIISLINAYQIHGFASNRFYKGAFGGWNWEYVVLVFSSIGVTMLGLLMISPDFALRRPFRERGLLFFSLTLVMYVRGIAWLWKWLGFQDHTSNLMLRYPITDHLSWLFTADVELTLMAPVLNKGMLDLGRREYVFVDIGILVLLIWVGPMGYLIPGVGQNWENVCMVYPLAGFLAFMDDRLEQFSPGSSFWPFF